MGGKRERTGVVAVSESSIQISFTFKGIHCRERLKLQPTPANLKRAEQHRAAILHAIAHGTFDYAITFPDSERRFLFAETKGAGHKLEDWLETWHERLKKHIKTSTWDGYRKIIYHTIIPAIGTIYLDELKRADIRAMLDKMTEASNKRLANVQSVLRLALKEAVDDDLLDVNPLYGWTYQRKEAPKTKDEIDPFTREEQEAILKASREPQHANLFKFAFWTGLRTNELVALKWGDIDWLRETLRVQRGRTQAAEVAEEPKTRRSVRDVKLLGPALEALEAQKKLTYLADGEVFHNPHTGKPWGGDLTIRTAWNTILKRAGVRQRYPYQTRHTYASMMLSAGEAPIWVASQMGHADLSMIYRNYGRWIPDAAPQAGNKAVELFGTTGKKKGCDKAAIAS